MPNIRTSTGSKSRGAPGNAQPSAREPRRRKATSDPLATAKALSAIAVERHASHVLHRGGAPAKAASAHGRGVAPSVAAANAAQQAKGHLAELELAATFTADSGVRLLPAICRINAKANARHADLEVVEGCVVKATVQVGTGSAKYLGSKVRQSQADQVVVDRDALTELGAAGMTTPATSDRVRHSGAQSTPVRAASLQRRATELLTANLEGRGRSGLPPWFGHACVAGVRTSVVSVVIDAVRRLVRGEPIDFEAIVEVLRGAWDAFLKGTTQAALAARHYLLRAKEAFDATLLHKTTRLGAWFGAIASFLIDTAKDLLAWARGQIALEEVFERGRRRAFECLGSAMAAVLTLWLFAGLPALLLAAFVCVGGALGAGFGGHVHDQLFAPVAFAQRPLL